MIRIFLKLLVCGLIIFLVSGLLFGDSHIFKKYLTRIKYWFSKSEYVLKGINVSSSGTKLNNKSKELKSNTKNK